MFFSQPPTPRDHVALAQVGTAGDDDARWLAGRVRINDLDAVEHET
jgi:hypothetical protein